MAFFTRENIDTVNIKSDMLLSEITIAVTKEDLKSKRYIYLPFDVFYKHANEKDLPEDMKLQIIGEVDVINKETLVLRNRTKRDKLILINFAACEKVPPPTTIVKAYGIYNYNSNENSFPIFSITAWNKMSSLYEADLYECALQKCIGLPTLTQPL